MDELELKKHYPHCYETPQIADSVFVAPGAHVYCDVHIGELSSVWFNTVIRGDVNHIRIGRETNIQDNSMVHVAYKKYPCLIGDRVTIGHNAIIHACQIGNTSLVGMGACILDGAEIGDYVVIGAGSLVTQKSKIPSGTLAFGQPAKVIRELTEEERAGLEFSAQHYVNLATTYRLQTAKTPS